MALTPNRYAQDTDEATKELLRRLLIGDPPPDTPRRFIQPSQPELPTSQPAQPTLTTTDAGNLPIRIPVDPNAPLPDPNWGMEQVARRQTTEGPRVDYSNVSARPELGIDYLNRTGKVRPPGEAPNQVETGIVLHDRAPAAPLPVRIPELSKASLADSVVQPPITDDAVRAAVGTRSDGLPNRFDPDKQDIPRIAGESDTDYEARKHRALQQALRTESPNSKVTETPTGLNVTPPQKPHGAKARLMAGLMLALDTLGEGLKSGGVPGAAGSAIVSMLTGVANPGLERKIARGREIAGADSRAKQIDEQQAREATTAERQARTADLQQLPQRRKDEERDKRITQRERNWERLVATTGFDPAHNAEHRKIQLEAANDGQILPATPAKPARATAAGPHTSTRIVGDGEYPGVKAGAKVRQIWNAESGNFEDDVINGKPQLAVDAPVRASDTTQANRVAENDSKRAEFEDAEKQARTQAEYFQSQATAYEQQAAALEKQNAAFAASGEADLTAGQKESLARAKELRSEARKASDKATEWWDKRADADSKSRNVPKLASPPKPTGTSYAGKTYTNAQVKAWAKSRTMSVRAARKLLEGEGATIK